MSSVFEVLFLFLFVVMSLLSSWDEMGVPVELLAYNVWAAEDDKRAFLSVGVDFLINYFWKTANFLARGEN